MGRSVDTRTYICDRWKGDYYKASGCVSKWSISWQSIKLGCYDKGSVCNIHDH